MPAQAESDPSPSLRTSVQQEMHPRYTASVTFKPFKEHVRKVEALYLAGPAGNGVGGDEVRKPGDWVGMYNPNTSEMFIYAWDEIKAIRYKNNLGNCMVKRARWPFKRGGNGVAGEWGHMANWAMSAFLLNTFNCWRDMQTSRISIDAAISAICSGVDDSRAGYTGTGLVKERWKDVVSAAGGDTVLIFMGGAEGCTSKHSSGPEWTAAAARTIKGDVHVSGSRATKIVSLAPVQPRSDD
ncbi:hypothetical protein B484DRAFT_390512 [Ochromonadaceae sp. CCMP2298]|nr:hypothetical protein B484DRAFT_390512 [Ochromonadaceae sp. CCMP2298]